MSGAALSLDRVWVALGARLLVAPLSLSVAPGTVTTIMGPSGCGKSSLLASLCGMLDPAFRCGGQAWLGDVDLGPLPPERRRLGILFQDDLLFPHLTVGENILFGLPPGPRARRRAQLDAALAEAGLAGFAERDPATLSGGQRARIALLRTLAARPGALLLDEPFARLDSELRNRFRSFVFGHGRRLGLPTLLVTHDPADAAAAGGPVVTIAPAAAAADATPQSAVSPRSIDGLPAPGRAG
jgi:putative thiamine transport system ATP-binding protein